MRAPNPLITYVSLAAFLFIVIVGPWLVFSSPVDIDPGCLFTHGQESFCSMTSLEHLEQWQSAFMFTLVQILSFAVCIAVVSIFFAIIQRLKPDIPFFFKRYQPTLFQQLFSQGILNSKAY